MNETLCSSIFKFYKVVRGLRNSLGYFSRTLNISRLTEFRCGGRFCFTLFHSLSTNPKVKELLQEAQLPQRNSASAAHMEGGWG